MEIAPSPLCPGEEAWRRLGLGVAKVSHYPSSSLSSVYSKNCRGAQGEKDSVALQTSVFLEKWDVRLYTENDTEEVGQEPKKSGEDLKMLPGEL